MKHNEDIMNLFANYAAEVGRHLPLKGREDIQREIIGTLADRLDDRMSSASRDATLEDAFGLLKETGHPRKTASSYFAHNRLIGPDLYPLFSLVCRIVLPVLAAVLVGALTLSAALRPDPGVSYIALALRIIGAAAQGALQAFGIIVLVFMGLERLDPAHRAASKLDPWEPWDPREIAKARPGEIRIVDQVLSMVFCTLAIVVLAFLPDLVDRVVLAVGQPATFLRLSDGLVRMLPWLIAVNAAELLLAVFLLTRRVHSGVTMAATSGVKAFSLIVAGFFLSVWTYVIPGPDTTSVAVFGASVLNMVIRGGAILGIVAGTFEIGRTVLRFVREGSAGGR